MSRPARARQHAPRRGSTPAAVESAHGWRAALPLLVLALVIAAHALLKAYALHVHRADEGIYHYDAVRVAAGTRLYRDLFFAHPPLQLVVPVALTRLFGYHFLLLKLLPQLCGVVQGLCVFVAARRLFRRPTAALLAATLLLFSEHFLKSSSFDTGVTSAGALFALALVAAAYGRGLAGGALAGAAAMTFLPIAPMVLTLGVAFLAHDRRFGTRWLGAAAAVIALVNLAGVALGGSAFVDQVYRYHLLKHGAFGDAAALRRLFGAELMLFVGAALSVALAPRLSPSAEQRRWAQGLAAAAAVELALLATRPTILSYYFQPLLLPLALGCGATAAMALDALAERHRRRRIAGGALAFALVLGPILLSPALGIGARRVPPESAPAYTFAPVPALGGINDVVRAVAFADGVRTSDGGQLATTEYLWSQSRHFDSYARLVAAVQAHTSASATLFGDSNSTPLVALGSGRHIFADFVDTNLQRFTSLLPPRDAIAALERDGGPTLVLRSGDSGLFALEPFRDWVTAHYCPLLTTEDADGTPYTLYRRDEAGDRRCKTAAL